MQAIIAEQNKIKVLLLWRHISAYQVAIVLKQRLVCVLYALGVDIGALDGLDVVQLRNLQQSM